tara:strand:- start:1588 stop:1812 length:225 start_codon:yes stop_codon:yes gene_type:complete
MKENVMTAIDHPQTSSSKSADKERDGDRQDHVLNADEKLDDELEDSMDASDPPSSTRPGDKGDPVPSSGFTPED